ncbi:ClpP/crotonase-like domain-containing protein [Mucidula mucida]|nr:ClpP/crotonase-like domain-containing protein [Mucidula mucida]
MQISNCKVLTLSSFLRLLLGLLSYHPLSASATFGPDYATLNFKEIIPTLNGAVLVVTLNRSKQYAEHFSTGLADELERIFQLADEDDRVRVVITTAASDASAYCSGADLTTGWGGLGGKGSPYETREPGGKVSLAVCNCRKITIAAVNGHALPYDFRFVWEGAKLVFPFVRRGIAPEGTITHIILSSLSHTHLHSPILLLPSLPPRHVPRQSALLSGTVLSLTSPLLAGLYYAGIPKREDVFPGALAESTSQTAVAMTKGLLVYCPPALEEVVEMESRTFGMLSKQGDAREAGKAFLEKRAPRMADGLAVLEKAGEWYPWAKL